MMKMKLHILLLVIFAIANGSCPESTSNVLSEGQQPQVAIDLNGIVRLVFGREGKIYCSTSSDDAVTFTEPKLVGEVKGVHLGMSRGPQVASSRNYTFITAIDKRGTIHSFQLDHGTNQWSESSIINDIPNSAPEGLMGIAADQNDSFTLSG